MVRCFILKCSAQRWIKIIFINFGSVFCSIDVFSRRSFCANNNHCWATFTKHVSSQFVILNININIIKNQRPCKRGSIENNSERFTDKITKTYYSRHPLSRIPATSNFHYVQLFIRSLQHSHSAISKILSVPSFIFGVFPIRYIEHLNEIFEWIILFISDNRILITALKKLCSEFCSFFFQHCPGNNVLS